MKNNLKCKYPTEKPKFVGLQIENGEATFIFPCKYQETEGDEQKKDMLNLLKLIEKYKTEEEVNDSRSVEGKFPFESYLWIIRDYFENGYFSVYEPQYKKGMSGKIDWKRTIKNNEIYLGNKNIVYKEFIVKQNKNVINHTLTEIHKIVVYIAVEVMGWYFDINTDILSKPVVEYPNDYMLSILKNEYNVSFTDYKKRLLMNMINVLEGVDESYFNNKTFDISTKDFEYVFERLIDERFGNQPTKKFNPSCKWCIGDKAKTVPPLRPDTILIHNNNAYIIDAKDYQYGYSGNKNQLPHASSVHKQITYAVYFERRHKEKLNIDKIYNVFLLPTASTDKMRYIGYATYDDSDYEQDKEEYNKIETFLVDLRALVNNDLGTKDKWINLLIDKMEISIFMKEKIDYERLRKDLIDYYGTALATGMLMAISELSKVEKCSNEELVEIARKNHFDLSKYIVKYK